MAKIFQKITDLIGGTPLLELTHIEQEEKLDATILGKLEFYNPAGSVKDRIAKAMLDEAEAKGLITPGKSVLIEPTSGNTGIGLAAVAAARGYRLIIAMPETMSIERRNLMKAFGAELVLTPAAEGMAGAVKRAEELAAATPKSFIPAQFDNPANPEAHYLTTGPELWRDTDGCVDLFVAGIGTGGTFSGTGRYLKEKNPNVKLVAVEPAGSPLLSGGKAGPHGLMGIGANFIPKNMDISLIDEIICVREEDAYAAGRDMVACEGVLVGITAGAALWAATQLALRPENAGKTIVALLPDGGERYLSTPMYQGE